MTSRDSTLVCSDANIWIAFFANDSGPDVQALDESLDKRTAVMAPIVLAELFSDPGLPASYEAVLASVHLMEFQEGFWERAGKLRAGLLGRRLKPKLADTLVAQLCIDHKASLLTRDRGFAPFARYAGLKLGSFVN